MSLLAARARGSAQWNLDSGLAVIVRRVRQHSVLVEDVVFECCQVRDWVAKATNFQLHVDTVIPSEPFPIAESTQV